MMKPSGTMPRSGNLAPARSRGAGDRLARLLERVVDQGVRDADGDRVEHDRRDDLVHAAAGLEEGRQEAHMAPRRTPTTVANGMRMIPGRSFIENPTQVAPIAPQSWPLGADIEQADPEGHRDGKSGARMSGSVFWRVRRRPLRGAQRRAEGTCRRRPGSPPTSDEDCSDGEGQEESNDRGPRCSGCETMEPGRVAGLRWCPRSVRSWPWRRRCRPWATPSPFCRCDRGGALMHPAPVRRYRLVTRSVRG